MHDRYSSFLLSAAIVIASSTSIGCRSAQVATASSSAERNGLAVSTSIPDKPTQSATPLQEPGSSKADAIQLTGAEQADGEPVQQLHAETDQPPIEKPSSDQPTLTLQNLEELALTSNPTLPHASAHVDAARGQQVQAGLYPNPTVGYHAVNVGTRGTAGRQAGFVQQRFVTGGKLELDERIAGHEIRNAQALLSAAQQRVLTDVRSRFYETLIAQRRQELAQELVDIATELVSSTKKLLDAEQASENTFLQAEIEAEQAAILLDNATNELHERWLRLAVVAGQPNLQQPRLVGDLEGVDADLHLDELTSRLSQANPRLLAAKARIDKFCVAVTRAKREVIPDVSLMADAARTNQTKSNTAQIRLGVEVPLWDRNEGNIAIAESKVAGARAEYRRIELQLRQQLATTFRQYANARHQTQRYRESILPRAERSLKLVRDGYENGQVEYLTLLNSQQKFVQVSLAYADAQEVMQKAAALLDGQLLSDSLSKGDD